MKQKRSIGRWACWALAAAALIGCENSREGECAVTRGANPAFSPDGKQIAFQRLENDVFKLGVVPAGGGTVTWIEEGPGHAAYPEWTPRGGLLYMYGHDTETAYEAWKGNSKNGIKEQN